MTFMISIVKYNLTRAAPFTYMKPIQVAFYLILSTIAFLFFGEIFEQSFAHFPSRHGKRRARRLL